VKLRVTLALVAIGFWLIPGLEAQKQFYANDAVSVTQANTAITFSDNGSGGSAQNFRARFVTVISETSSANTCFFDMKDTTATTADIPIAPGDTWSLAFEDLGQGGGLGGWSGVGAVCDTGETATFRIVASR
jgi:hypothetical protein